MLKNRLWCLFIVIMTSPTHAQTDPALRDLTDRFWEVQMEFAPTRATALGDYRYNDRIADLSADARRRWREKIDQLLSDLGRVSRTALSPDDQLTHRICERTLRDDIMHWECGDYLTPLDPLSGAHLDLPLLLVSHPFRNAKDYHDYISRLHGWEKQVSDLIANMRDGLRKEVVSPRAIVEKVIPQVRTHIVPSAEKSEFFAPMRMVDALSDIDRAAIDRELRDVITKEVVPGYLRLLSFLEDEYLPFARETVGIGALPGGQEVYTAKAYLNTTVRTPPAEIHALGLSEVERIRGEMDKVRSEVGFTGTLDEFLAHMRTDPKQRFTSGEELFQAADVILKRAQSKMPQLFGRLPKADCVMKELEAFRAPASPVAYYNPAPADGSRPGYYYINTYAPQERLRFTLEALTYHEAVPGHHLQYMLDQENKDLPKFRRYASYNAYGEGWALYTEKLGYEIGGYADPYSRFGQLTFEIWRACRLVVDTGMHHKGWSRQQAIDYMLANSSLAKLDIESEIDRYITWPGQALSYKIGEIRIIQLRKDAEAALGDKFNLRSFHDYLLSGGQMPIDILEERMKEWVSRQN